MKKLLIFCTFLMYCLTSNAEDLEQLEKQWHINNHKDPVLEALEAINKVSDQKIYECNRAFGSNSFCQCLVNRLPVSITFTQYNAIVIRSKEQLQFKKTSEEHKSLINSIYLARNKCVTRI
jgi:hypothetical protein